MSQIKQSKEVVFVFDLDDTLYDQLAVFKKAISPEFELTAAKLRQFYVDFRYFSDVMFKDSQDGKVARHDMHCMRLMLAAEKNNIAISKSQAAHLQLRYSEIQSEIVLDKNIKQILEFCREKKIKMALLSNGPTKHQLNKIKKLHLQQYFDDEKIFISGEMEYAKPMLEAFNICSSHFVDSNSIKYEFYMIGDSYENDIVGGINAKWNTIWLNKYQKSNTKHVDITHTIVNTAELSVLIKGIYEKYKCN